MISIIDTLKDPVTAAIAVLTLTLSYLLAREASMKTDDIIRDTFGFRYRKQKETKLPGFAGRLIDKSTAALDSAGIYSEYARVLYMLTKYLLPLPLALIGGAKSLPAGVLAGVIIHKLPDMAVRAGVRKNNRILQRYLYKIYRFLNNQITSGVKVTDAFKSVYAVVEEPTVRAALAEASARFRLTNDIDAAMDQFKKRFSCNEADTLRVVLKQCLDTGANPELLEKQEQYLFGKYFNLIQAETEKYRYRSFAAALMFLVLLCLMFFVPIYMDLRESIANLIP